GIRPSAANGAPVTSTGCPSLDAVLSGHGGLPTGSLFFIEESGTTDFASVLLRYFAAEGLLQGHTVWLGGGLPESWFRSLPLVTDKSSSTESSASSRNAASSAAEQERMKIAWRYQSLPDFGSGVRERPPTTSQETQPGSAKDLYCHAYDLTKRLTLAPEMQYTVSPSCAPSSATGSADPFAPLLASLIQTLTETTGFIRAVIPFLLSPALYPPGASQPRHFIRFLNNLRLVCRQYPHRIAIMATLPLDLYPRNTSMTTWAEILSDGVLELTPLPSPTSDVTALETSSMSMAGDPTGPQGLLKLIKIPQLERWSAGSEVDLAFKVTRKRFSIEAWSLPALGEEE
ncbi:Elongator complex protein 4, partial [Protomyces lactucae-debilis]